VPRIDRQTVEELSQRTGFQMDEMRKSFIFSLCLDGDPRDVTADILDEISPHDVKANLLPMLR